MATPTGQPFQVGTRYEQRHYPQQYGGCALPSSEHGGITALRQASSSAAPERSSLSSGTGRSAMEAMALKVHSEAERRRRERINAHLATLRRMIVPGSNSKQMDKATLLATAVGHLNDLKRKASEATQPMPIPAEADGITVDCYTGANDRRTTLYIHASVSCDDRPGLLADIAAVVRGLRLRAVRADVASLGGRTQCSFVLCKDGGDVNLVMSEGMKKALEEDVRQALASAAFAEVVHGWSGSSNKRQRRLESRFLYSRSP